MSQDNQKQNGVPATVAAVLAREQPFSFRARLPKGEVKKAIILLHGMTHNAKAMLLKARSDLATLEPDAALYALNAPFTADPEQHRIANHPRHSQQVRVWFEMPSSRFNTRGEVVPQMRVSIAHVRRLIDHVKASHGLEEDQIYLLAFSQGCAPALQGVLDYEREHKRGFGGLALLCGFAWDPAVYESAESRTNRFPLQTRTFFAMVRQDDVVGNLLPLRTANFMKSQGMPVTLHTSPAHLVSHNGIRYRRPSYLRFDRAQMTVDGEGVKPLGPSDIWRGKAIIRFTKADDGYGNESLSRPDVEQSFRPTAHFVNSSIRTALELWHAHGLVDPQFGAQPIDMVRFPRVTQKMIEYGWAAAPIRLEADQAQPLPAWHSRYEHSATLRQRFTHLCTAGLGIAFACLAAPFQRWLYHHPSAFDRVIPPLLFSVKPQAPARIRVRPPRDRLKEARNLLKNI